MRFTNYGGRRFNWRNSGRRMGSSIALIGLAAMLSACGPRDNVAGTAPNNVTPVSETTTGFSPMPLYELVDDPMKYQGRTVTVAGEVDDIIGPRAFTLDNGFDETAPELLVVTKADFPAIPNRPANEYLVDDDIVMVTGTIRTFNRTDLGSELGLDFTDAVYEPFESKAVLVVDNVVTTPRLRQPGTSAMGAANTALPVTDVLIIVTAPDRLAMLGRRVELNNVKVQSVVSDKGFWIGPNQDQRLFVMLNEVPTPATPVEGRYNIEPGQTINITGEIRRLPDRDQIERQWGLSASEMVPLSNERIYLFADRVSNIRP